MTESIRSKAFRGMIWTSLERLGSQLLQFSLGIIVARQLMPADYGLVGMLAIFMAISQTLIDSGFANALIRKQDRTETDFATAFYFNSAVGFLLYSVMFLCSPFIAHFFDTPKLEPIIKIYTLSLIFNSLTIVQTAKLSIALNFRLQSLVTLSTTLVCGITAIILAYNNFGVWALVVQALGASALRFALLWTIVRWRPPLIFSVNSFRILFSFGSKLLASSLINTIYENIYTIIIGKKFTPSDVGFFNRAIQFAAMPSDALTSIITKVNYPVLSSLQDDNSKLLKAYSILVRTPVFLLTPFLLGLCVVAEPLITVLLGSKWLPSAEYLQILCLGYIWVPLTHINLNVLYVKGRSDLVLKLELIKKPIAFTILILTIPFGVKAMCIGKAFYEFIAFAFNCYYTGQILGFGLRSQLREILPILTKSGIMAILVMIISNMLPSDISRLLVCIPAGFMFYFGIAVWSKDDSLNEIRKSIQSRRNAA